MLNFRSDNTAPAAPEILAALAQANQGDAPAYGEDVWSARLEAEFARVFERTVHVFPVISGTAANAIAIGALSPPWGAVVCHREAHIECDECGAPAFYSGGAKALLAEGAFAKINAAAVDEAVRRNERGIHSVKPSVLSISQSTERGAVYTSEELQALGAAARRHRLGFHVDGARFANAVAAGRSTPADLSWRAGVDLMSFGASKNGALAAEALLCFDATHAESIARLRKRGGHLIAKGRFVSAQLLAYLEGDLWLRLAERANALARQLGAAAEKIVSAPVETNQIFIKPGADALAQLRAQGAAFYDWGGDGDEARLVTSWSQSERDVEAMARLLRAL